MILFRDAAIVVIVLVMSASSAGAQAPVQAQTPAQSVSPSKGTAQRLKPNLSKSECTQFGGTVNDIDVNICKSGSACTTTTENGQHHVVCIGAIK
jgi:hypothetical protein